ncbi:RecX family transcriptional regulator [bacterium]|nr:RecX family transcriptional regulator [bacterium]
MPVITRLQAIGRHAASTRVEIDGEPWMELDTEVVLRFALWKGMEADDAFQRTLAAEHHFIRARRATAILLNTRLRASNELRRRLREKKFDEATVERTVAHFEEKGDLDDERFARLYLRNELKKANVGPLKAREKLRSLGVAEEFIDRAIAEAEGAGREGQLVKARRLAEKRARIGRDESALKLKKRIHEALRRAGFESDICRVVVEEMTAREGRVGGLD